MSRSQLSPKLISTHAPARGATRPYAGRWNAGRDFNPRPCTRSDAAQCTQTLAAVGFQPTPLHEERPRVPQQCRKGDLFQPTPLHEERRRLVVLFALGHGISTHAPARGATSIAESGNLDRLFQPTPLHEERRLQLGAHGVRINISTHAPARGATTGSRSDNAWD